MMESIENLDNIGVRRNPDPIGQIFVVSNLLHNQKAPQLSVENHKFVFRNYFLYYYFILHHLLTVV